MNDFGIKNMDQVAPVSSSYRGTLKRQPAFDTFDGSLLAVFPSLNEEQTLQEVPTGLDSISHDSTNCELPLLTPCSKAVMSQALKATFSGFKKEQRRLGIPKNPWLWTEQQVCQWLLWATNEFSLVDVNLQRFGMTGQVLCNLGKERFLELAPDFVGDILWEHLEQMIKGTENQEKTEDQYEANSHLNSVPHWINSNSLGFGAEQALYGMQTQNYPKGGLLDGLCPASSAPSTLGPEQDFQMFPKARLSTVSVNYCSISQDFPAGTLNLLSSSSGKPGDHDSAETGADSFESSESLLQSWNSQSSLLDVQRVPSFESFEDDCSQSLGLSKPTMSFKDYIQERSDPVEQGKPVIPAAVLAGFTDQSQQSRAQWPLFQQQEAWRKPSRILTSTQSHLHLNTQSRARSHTPCFSRMTEAMLYFKSRKTQPAPCPLRKRTYPAVAVSSRIAVRQILPAFHQLDGGRMGV
ncbi:protein C-ets-2 isoform 3-T3 [Megaptera novaeangliae]